MFGLVPVLPVVIPLCVALFVVLVWLLHVQRQFTLPRAAVAVVLSVYAGGVVANTVFPIYLNPPKSVGPWIPPVNLVPFIGYEFADAVTNMLVFLPLGLLVPLLIARPSWWRVCTTITVISLTIEVTQFITAGLVDGGHIADVNDWFFNVLGGSAGFGLFSLLTQVPVAADLIYRFRWGQHHVTASEAQTGAEA